MRLIVILSWLGVRQFLDVFVLTAELLKTRNEPFTTEQILLIQHRYLAGDCWRELGIALGIDPRRLDSLK